MFSLQTLKIIQRKDRMKDHIRGIHYGMDNSCNLCGKNYATRHSLLNHMSRYHH